MISQAPQRRAVGVDRSLAALRALADYPRGIALDDLARLLQQPKSSTHRALAALRRAGFIEQDGYRQYRLSLGFVRLAFSFYDSLDQQAVVQPLLESLAESLGEVAHYAVLDGSDVVYIARAAPRRAVFQMAATVGGRQPAHSTALGRILLSYDLKDVNDVEQYIDDHDIRHQRQNEKINAKTLARKLKTTRARGYGLDNEENELGVNCIAFPLFLGPATHPTGAISISAVAQRTPLDDLVAKADSIRSMIEQTLGQVTLPA